MVDLHAHNVHVCDCHALNKGNLLTYLLPEAMAPVNQLGLLHKWVKFKKSDD